MGRETAPTEWAPGPEEPALPGEEVHLWLAGLGPGAWSSDLALRAVLGRYLREEPDSVEIIAAEGGKPRLAVRPERLRFNLSHSGELALIGVSGLEIGVDVEWVRPRRRALAIAERSLPPAAGAAVRSASEAERPAVFAVHWTRFEARQKCLGLGVFDEAPTEASVAITSIDVAPGYASAFAVAATTAPPTHTFRLSP